MKKITAYLAMKYRGSNGDSADESEIKENVHLATILGNQIRQAFPEIDLYVPHERQEIVHRLWEKHYVSSDQIIEATSEIAAEKDFLIMFGAVSGGMIMEGIAVKKAGKPVLPISIFDNEAKRKIRYIIDEIRKNRLSLSLCQ